MVLVDDLNDFQIREIFLKGRARAEYSFDSSMKYPENSMHIRELSEKSFEIPVGGKKVRAIELIPGQIVTKASLARPAIKNGLAHADPGNDLVKLAVVERHRATGNIGLGFVRGLGLVKGALASTVAHDSHNLIIAGTNDQDMLTAAIENLKTGGGLAVGQDYRVLACLPLPVAGLMSDKLLEDVLSAMKELDIACRSIGVTLDNPFMVLSFLALPVIPELKLTDKGLVDVHSFELVNLWLD